MRAEIEADLKAWDAIEDHRTGTAGDHRTAEWLADSIRRAGAEPRIEAFDFRRRVLNECAVTVDDAHIDGVPQFDGGVTDANGVRAPLAPLGKSAADDIALAVFDPSPSPATQALITARERGAAKAIVAVAAGEAIVPGLALLNADRFTAPYGPPVLQVPSTARGQLDAAASAGAEAHVVAHVTFEDTTASNVLTTVHGRDPDLAPLVVMTPRSAWWTCTAERGGGIVGWLACIRHFATNPPTRDVIFTANTGHELGHVGLEHLLSEDPARIRGAHAWLHLGANFASVGGRVVYQASDEALMALGLRQLAAEGIEPDVVVPVGQRPGGEAHNIFDGGGRYLSLLGSNRWFHHPDDRWPQTIDLDKTEKITRAVVEMAETLAGR